MKDFLQRLADRLPPWVGSIRFRLTAIYSLVLFGLAALFVGGIFIWFRHKIRTTLIGPLIPAGIQNPNGSIDPGVITSMQNVQRLANEHALHVLRDTSATALSLLFLTSLVVGWFVAGKVLTPIGRITAVARDIQATDLSRRINLPGPADELRLLADTFDEMLGRLDEAFEGQRRFIHEASHELRNPLAVIRANVDVALSDPDVDASTLRETIEVVSRTIGRISRLVDDLLSYADRGSPVHEHAPVNVTAIVEASAAEFRASAEERGLVITAEARPGLWVLGDEDALRRVLANLLANALRLAPTGTDIVVAAGASGDWVWFAVDDAGPGIPEEQREHVFQRFWRGDASLARSEGRSGLGLAIVRQIIEAHRGSIRLLTSQRGGSTFAVWLPATGNDGGKPPSLSEELGPQASPTGRGSPGGSLP